MATAENAQISFGQSPGIDATHVHCYDAITGGNFLWSLRMSNNPDPLLANENYAIAAGGIVFTVNPSANQSEEHARRALRGIMGGTVYLAMATGSSASTELTGPGRKAISEDQWTIT